MRRAWPPIIERARELALAFEARCGRPPILRRLHYELVSDASATAATYRNTPSDYKQLSELTAEARRDDTLPDLSENVRRLSQVRWFEDADDLRQHVREIARLDRMKGQENSVCVEKDSTHGFLADWFNDYGVQVTSLNGYPSQTLVDRLDRCQYRDGRSMIVLYAGDLRRIAQDE